MGTLITASDTDTINTVCKQIDTLFKHTLTHFQGKMCDFWQLYSALQVNDKLLVLAFTHIELGN